MEFEFITAGRIVFGRGSLGRAGRLAREFGHRALVVTGSKPERAERLLSILKAAGVEGTTFPTPAEPDLSLAREGRDLARAEDCKLVVSIGGGSAIDAGKAIAALATNPGDVLDYLEVIGGGKPLPEPSLPFLAIPTTAGTGSEVTRNAVLASAEHGVKASLRSPSMLAKVALVDPALTDSMPSEVSATTGLDALTQLIEVFVCSRSNAFTDGLCREGIARAARALPIVTKPAPGPGPRDDMALAALFSGLGLANAGLGAVHGFAGPIGGMFPAPHGAVCAILLGPVLEVNRRALEHRVPNSSALPRFDELGRLLTGRPEAGWQEAVHWVNELVQRLRIPRLRQYGIAAKDKAGVVDGALRASSMKANPVSLTRGELEEILEKAI